MLFCSLSITDCKLYTLHLFTTQHKLYAPNIQLDEKSIRLSEQTKELEKRDKQLENRDKQIDELIKKAGINNSDF